MLSNSLIALPLLPLLFQSHARQLAAVVLATAKLSSAHSLIHRNPYVKT